MTNNITRDPYLPMAAEILECVQESRTIFTVTLGFVNPKHHEQFDFYPGQFNMVYLYGVGEVAISIISDPKEKTQLRHTIRAVGRVTKALQQCQRGDMIGLRGPFGQGWPLKKAHGKDVLIITGGLGCAPTVSIINFILARRDLFGDLKILQGVKHSEDFIFRQQYAKWRQSPRTEIHIAADQAGPAWPWGIGYVTDMISSLTLDVKNTLAMMCGPEMMMHTAIKALAVKGLEEDSIYMSMERNMECGIGHCGHCQVGGLFVCKDGPVFAYPRIKALFSEAGF